jgi:hypothetical protein
MENVLNMFKTEIEEKYKIVLNMQYKQNIKEVWENDEEIDILSFIECITIQLRIMELMNITFFAISMEDIYLLSHEKPFYIILSKDIIKIKQNHFTFIYPPVFSRDKDEYLFYPELLQMKKIPQTFHKSVIYYSVGLIVFSFLFGCPIWKEEYLMDNIPIVKYIEKIKETKQYYFLKRCFTSSELLFV